MVVLSDLILVIAMYRGMISASCGLFFLRELHLRDFCNYTGFEFFQLGLRRRAIVCQMVDDTVKRFVSNLVGGELIAALSTLAHPFVNVEVFAADTSCHRIFWRKTSDDEVMSTADRSAICECATCWADHS